MKVVPRRKLESMSRRLVKEKAELDYREETLVTEQEEKRRDPGLRRSQVRLVRVSHLCNKLLLFGNYSLASSRHFQSCSI